MLPLHIPGMRLMNRSSGKTGFLLPTHLYPSNNPGLVSMNDSFWLRFQPVDATHRLNRSVGVLKSNVFLGRSLSCLATAFSLY